MKRTILIYGTISGTIVATFMATAMALTSKGSDMAGSMIVGYASMMVAFLLIFVAVKNYRDKQNGGIISFGQAFKMGILIAIIGSTFYVVTWSIEYKYFLPDFMDKYSAMQIKQVQEAGVSGTKLEEAIKSIEDSKEMYKNPFFFTLITYAEILPVGIIITLISALILKRKIAKTA